MKNNIVITEENKFGDLTPLVLLVLSLASAEQGDFQQSTAFLASAYTQATSANGDSIQDTLASLTSRLKSELDPTVFVQGWQQGISPDFETTIRHLMQRFETFLQSAHLDDAPRLSGVDGNQRLVEPLTARELEVLQLLDRGLRNRDIAVVMCVTENTIKKHLYHIYDKLLLTERTRTQAIRIARKLDLL